MKVAIISLGHYGSTMPLARHLAMKGCDVDYYIYCNHRVRSIEGIEIHHKKWQFGTCQLKGDNIPKHNDYFNISSLRVYLTSTRNVLGKVVGYFRDLNHSIAHRRFTQRLRKKDYDIINIVCRYNSDIADNLISSLPVEKLIVSLHEVVNHSSPDYQHPSSLMKNLFEQNIHIIVHSQNVYKSIKNYSSCVVNRLSIIPFGVFETYKLIDEDISLELPLKYILVLGYISPYKGIDILYDAVNKIDLSDYRVIIAGSGKVPVIDKIVDDPRYLYIPGYLTNERIVRLIKHSNFIICPYLSMSQSGIPQTAFVFNKAILASDLQGFKEIIKDGFNGYLVEKGNAEELAHSIAWLIDHPDVIKRTENNIEVFKKESELYSWEQIVNKYIELFKSKLS